MNMYPSLIELAMPLFGVLTYIRIFQAVLHMLQILFPPQRLLFFKKPRKRGKGGINGKAEKRERRKKRERKGKAKKASARFLSKYGARPGGGGGGCALRCLHAGLWNKEF